jgi:hypothetical protein
MPNGPRPVSAPGPRHAQLLGNLRPDPILSSSLREGPYHDEYQPSDEPVLSLEKPLAGADSASSVALT